MVWKGTTQSCALKIDSRVNQAYDNVKISDDR